jgi:WD40 repeat protein
VFDAGDRLVSVSHDKTVKVWDVAKSACVMTLEGHSRSVRRPSVRVLGAPHLGFSFGSFLCGVFVGWLWRSEAVTCGVVVSLVETGRILGNQRKLGLVSSDAAA